MTRELAEKTISEMKDFYGMHKVIKKVNYNSINHDDNDYYVDYVPHRSMAVTMGMAMDSQMPICTIEKNYRASLLREDCNNIPLNVWLKAGTPPNGRSKKQHIAIQNLNKRKKR